MWRFICVQSADIFNFCHHFVPASCSFEARLFDGEGVQPLSAHRRGGGGGDLTCQENFRFQTGTASLAWFLEVKTHTHTHSILSIDSKHLMVPLLSGGRASDQPLIDSAVGQQAPKHSQGPKTSISSDKKKWQPCSRWPDHPGVSLG